MLSIQAFASLSITFYLLLLNSINPNSALDTNTDLCSPYPCNQPPQPPSSTGYSPYGNPPPPSSPPPTPRSHCPPVPKTDCCNQPPSSTTYPPPYPYFFTPPYPYGTLGGGGVGGQGGGGGGGAGGSVNGAAVAYYSPCVQVYVLMIMLVLSEAFVVL